MTVLLIDTSGREAQVAIVQDMNVVVHHVWENTPHVGPQILNHIEEVLQEGNISWDHIDRIAVHRGPRKENLFFSGLRTGITTAGMLASAKQKEVAGISGESLEEMLAVLPGAMPQEVILPVYE